MQARYKEHVNQLMRVAAQWHDKLSVEDPDLLRKVKTWNASGGVRPDRLRCWLEYVDSESMYEWSQKLLEGITPTPDKFCLSDDWVTWHFLRLSGIYFLEQTFHTHHGSIAGAEVLEHDLQDIFYVTLLCRVDGLLSRDKKLVQPLARAAFPEKDVFSSLEKVPDSYRCDWM